MSKQCNELSPADHKAGAVRGPSAEECSMALEREARSVGRRPSAETSAELAGTSSGSAAGGQLWLSIDCKEARRRMELGAPLSGPLVFELVVARRWEEPAELEAASSPLAGRAPLQRRLFSEQLQLSSRQLLDSPASSKRATVAGEQPAEGGQLNDQARELDEPPEVGGRRDGSGRRRPASVGGEEWLEGQLAAIGRLVFLLRAGDLARASEPRAIYGSELASALAARTSAGQTGEGQPAQVSRSTAAAPRHTLGLGGGPAALRPDDEAQAGGGGAGSGQSGELARPPGAVWARLRGRLLEWSARHELALTVGAIGATCLLSLLTLTLIVLLLGGAGGRRARRSRGGGSGGVSLAAAPLKASRQRPRFSAAAPKEEEEHHEEAVAQLERHEAAGSGLASEQEQRRRLSGGATATHCAAQSDEFWHACDSFATSSSVSSSLHAKAADLNSNCNNNSSSNSNNFNSNNFKHSLEERTNCAASESNGNHAIRATPQPLGRVEDLRHIFAEEHAGFGGQLFLHSPLACNSLAAGRQPSVDYLAPPAIGTAAQLATDQLCGHTASLAGRHRHRAHRHHAHLHPHPHPDSHSNHNHNFAYNSNTIHSLQCPLGGPAERQEDAAVLPLGAFAQQVLFVLPPSAASGDELELEHNTD